MQAISAHPFTICSSPSHENSELVFYIRHGKGFTAKLYQHALDHPEVAVPVMIDGPYGGINMWRLHEAGRTLVIAGGSGAGWCLPFVEGFVQDGLVEDTSCSCSQPTAKRNVSMRETEVQSGKALSVVLATRDPASRVWFERSAGAILDGFASTAVQVQVYLTGNAAHEAEKAADQASTSGSDKHDPEKDLEAGKEFEGRPELPAIIRREAALAREAGQSLGVYVCGPETMQNDVRNAVARENLSIICGGSSGSVYLHCEHFSWA